MGGYTVGDAAVVRARLDEAVAAFPICRLRARDPAGALSGGEQKQVELARTLILDPALVLLDEPSIGLAPKLVSKVLQTMRTLARAGLSILLVEQNVRAALEVVDRLVLLERGRVVLEGPAAQVGNDPRIAEAYLGATAA